VSSAATLLTSTFPNLDTTLRMFLCMSIANCSGERFFSAFKRVKNYLRSTIGQQRMDSLSLLTIECDLANIIEYIGLYDDVIDTFAECKARKKNNYNKLFKNLELCFLCLSVKKKTTDNMLNLLMTSLL